MPPKNSVKLYMQNGFYHIYNRGVEKRVIFKDAQDYAVFLGYLKEYLLPIPSSLGILPGQGVSLEKETRKNYTSSIELLAFALMPNHFHLQIRQNELRSMEGFLRSLATRYSMYFNRRYERVGGLFQGTYKAVLVESDEYLIQLSRYIHLNPLDLLDSPGRLNDYPYTSLPDYLGLRQTAWIKTDEVLSYFGTIKDNNATTRYRQFIEQSTTHFDILPKALLLDNEPPRDTP